MEIEGLDKEVAWKYEMKKSKSWKVPGPDCIVGLVEGVGGRGGGDERVTEGEAIGDLRWRGYA